MHRYFPSCRFTAAFPEVSRRIQVYLSEKPDIAVMGCCRPGQAQLDPGDTVLTICTSCALITREASPHAREMSIYQYLLDDPAFPWPDLCGERIAVQDCRRVRTDAVLQDAVRECLRRMNAVPVELPENRQNTRFDGVWYFNPAAPGNLSIAPKTFGAIRDHELTLLPKEEQLSRMRSHAASLPDLRIAAYCNACVSGLKMGGANAVHLMELITRDL